MKAIKESLAVNGGPKVVEEIHWNPAFGKDEITAVNEVINSQFLSIFRGGPKVKQFEQEFARHEGAQFGVATTSGTSALHTAVAALGIKEGDEVLVPALTFVSTASVVLQQGAKVVFVDIDPKTFCISLEDIETKITRKTKAIMPVHLFGYPADIESIAKIAEKYNLILINDAAQAHGARINKNSVGHYRDCSCYSFFQSKNMTTGEGGMVITSDEEIAKKLRLKREHGSPSHSSTWYTYDELGYNYSMTEMQAAIGIVQLKKLDQNNDLRRKNAAIYRERLKSLNIEMPFEGKDIYHVYHLFQIVLPKDRACIRDEMVKAIKAEGVPMDIIYPYPLYKANLFKDQYADVCCPNTEDITSRMFSLFTDPKLDPKYIELFCEAIHKVSKTFL